VVVDTSGRVALDQSHHQVVAGTSGEVGPVLSHRREAVGTSIDSILCQMTGSIRRGHDRAGPS